MAREAPRLPTGSNGWEVSRLPTGKCRPGSYPSSHGKCRPGELPVFPPGSVDHVKFPVFPREVSAHGKFPVFPREVSSTASSRLPTGSVGREVTRLPTGSNGLAGWFWEFGRAPAGPSATPRQGRTCFRARPRSSRAVGHSQARPNVFQGSAALQQGRRPLSGMADRGFRARPRSSKAVGHSQARPNVVSGFGRAPARPSATLRQGRNAVAGARRKSRTETSGRRDWRPRPHLKLDIWKVHRWGPDPEGRWAARTFLPLELGSSPRGPLPHGACVRPYLHRHFYKLGLRSLMP